MATVNFDSWRRHAGKTIGASPQAGRPTSHLELEVTDTAWGTPPPGRVDFALYGPGDVSGLRPGAIRARFPRPGQQDAESAFCPYAELAAVDLPWRNSPKGAENDEMLPWLALIVLTPSEASERRGSEIVVARSVLDEQPALPATAHVQADSAETSRILCLRELDSKTDYLAFIVPAFTIEGRAAWGSAAPASASVTLSVYDEWAFRTGEDGTFKTLALKLRAADDLAGFGRIPVSLGTARAERVKVRGALTGIAETVDPPPSPKARARLKALLAFGVDKAGRKKAGRKYVGPPRYGEAWRLDVARRPTPGGWVEQLKLDPTHRVIGGLGLRAGIDLQDEIAGAAGDRLGGTEAANQRINGLVAGLSAARALWNGRLPAGRNGRLAVLGLGAGRILATGEDGDTKPLLLHATGPDRTLPPAFFSTAARRILRPRSARLRHAGKWSSTFIEVANTPRTTVRRPEDAPDNPRYSDGTACADTLIAYVNREVGSCRLRDGQQLDRGDELTPAVSSADIDIDRETRAVFKVVVDLIGNARERPRTRPADLDELDRALVLACDPNTDPSAAERVLQTIDPEDPEPLAPREPCASLDLPAWRYLRDREPEWLLPGASTLDDGEVVGLASNPVFVDAFMVGWNTQALGELRWRNIRVASGCTPLRHFWDSSVGAGESHEPSADIVGIQAWTTGTPEAAVDPRSLKLGDPSHAPVGVQRRQLVVAFRTDLFRRYPSTLVYLSGPAPPAVPTDADLAIRVLPSFVAQVSSNLVLFAFPLDPGELHTKWVVVEQQPPGYRFERGRDKSKTGTSAARAGRMLVPPVRVVLAGTSLVGGG